MRKSIVRKPTKEPIFSAREQDQSPAVTDDEVALARSVRMVQPSEEGLQTAARLKIMLGSAKRMAAFAGLTENDGSAPLVLEVGAALALIDPAPLIIIDGNFHSPGLHKLLELPQSPGLLDVLEGRCSLDTAAYSTPLPNLFILSLGEAGSERVMPLNTPESERTFHEIREQFHYVLIDAGVVLATSEGVMLSSMCDGLVAAMAAGKRRRHEVDEFVEGLKRLNLSLLGIVLTKNLP